MNTPGVREHDLIPCLPSIYWAPIACSVLNTVSKETEWPLLTWNQMLGEGIDSEPYLSTFFNYNWAICWEREAQGAKRVKCSSPRNPGKLDWGRAWMGQEIGKDFLRLRTSPCKGLWKKYLGAWRNSKEATVSPEGKGGREKAGRKSHTWLQAYEALGSVISVNSAHGTGGHATMVCVVVTFFFLIRG